MQADKHSIVHSEPKINYERSHRSLNYLKVLNRHLGLISDPQHLIGTLYWHQLFTYVTLQATMKSRLVYLAIININIFKVE